MNVDLPFQPGQRVLVCLEEPESGGNLGYYGTILRVLGSSKTQFPDQPNLWHYRVAIPSLQQRMNVAGAMLLSTGIFDVNAFDDDLDRKINFDERPAKDNVEISGSYRLPARGVTYFMFRKSDSPVATYRLEMQVDTDQPESLLIYQVPRHAKLNPAYIRWAIRDLLGIAGTSDNHVSAG